MARACSPRTTLALALLAGTPATPARAYEARVDARTDVQLYTFASPYGDPIVRRRRVTQQLGLALDDLDGAPDPRAASLGFRARLRLDGDFGQSPAERSPRTPERFVPGLEEAPLDLVYAYLDGDGYLGGVAGFRVGRQQLFDALGWWSFDGGLLRLSAPAYVAVEAYAGYEQRSSLPLTTDRYAADGVWRGRRDDLETALHPAYLDQRELAPAWGAALGTSGMHWVQGKLAYRRVQTRDVVVSAPFPDAGGGWQTVGGARVASERAGGAVQATLPELGVVGGRAVYDLYLSRATEYDASVDAYLTPELTVGAGLDHYLPTFDGDSIFNWFSHQGMTTYEARAEWAPSRRFAIAASGGLRAFTTQGDPERYASAVADADPAPPPRGEATRTDAVTSLDARHRTTEGSVAARGVLEAGERGHRRGGDVTLRRLVLGGRFDALGIVSLYDWRDALRPDRAATSLQYVLGWGVRAGRRARFGAEWEHAMNRLVGQRYRVVATLELEVGP